MYRAVLLITIFVLLLMHGINSSFGIEKLGRIPVIKNVTDSQVIHYDLPSN